MKLVIVSDTHMPRMAKKLPERLAAELAGADYILHAGDWTRLSVWEALSAYAPTDGVAGNNDGPEIAAKFGCRKTIELGGVAIGLVHGHGTGRSQDTEARALASFADEKPDLIIFGHSHVPLLKKRGGTVMFNPGSATDKRRQPHYSFGVVRIGGGGFSAEHIFYDSKA